jgi:hypothetical protein
MVIGCCAVPSLSQMWNWIAKAGLQAIKISFHIGRNLAAFLALYRNKGVGVETRRFSRIVGDDWADSRAD